MNEPMQDGLRDALRRLRESAAGQSAPAALEDQLKQAFRAQYRRKPLQRKEIWISAAIAASVAIGFVSYFSRPLEMQRSPAPVPVAAKAVPAVAVETPVIAIPVAAKKRRPRSKPTRPLSVAAAKPPQQFNEQPFVQIPYAPPFTRYDEGQVLRVNMTGSSVRRMGIPVAAQQVQADLLVGNDGLPRAVRLVSHSPNRY